MQKFFALKVGMSLKKKFYRAWLIDHRVKKNAQKKMNYAVNKLRRQRARLLFGSWRGVTHTWFKEKCESEKEVFRGKLN